MGATNCFSAQVRVSRRHVVIHVAGGAAAALGLPTLAISAPKVFRIGSTLDLTGVEKANGTGLNLGATTYFNALNAAGGINGVKVELITKDDQFKPEVAKANSQAFDSDPSIIALLHPLGTRQTAAAMDAVPAMAIVGPNTGTVALRKKGALNTFFVRANYDQEIDKLIETAATLGITRIGLVHPNDPLGQSLLAAFKVSTAKFNLTPAVIATTPGTTSPEVQPAVLEIAKVAPQVVIVGLAGTAPLFVRALREAGSAATIYGLSITASATNIKELGDLARGFGFSIVVPSPYSTKYEIVRRFQTDTQAAGSTEYSLAALEGYINARVLAEGLRRAGANPTRESLVNALSAIESLDFGGIRIGYSRVKREGSSFVDVAVIGPAGKMLS